MNKIREAKRRAAVVMVALVGALGFLAGNAATAQADTEWNTAPTVITAPVSPSVALDPNWD